MYELHAYEIDRDHGRKSWDIWKEWPDGDAEYQYSINEDEFPAYMHALKNSGIDIKVHTLDALYVHTVYRGLALVEDTPDSVASVREHIGVS